MKIPEASRLFRRRDSAGFSLVELLVVVAVPALLTALLLAVLPGVRDRGRRSVCRGNLRQLALAIHLDGADNRDRLPNGRHPVRTAIYLPLGHTNVARALTSYAGSSNILDCPNVRPMLVGSNAWRWPYERVSWSGPRAWGMGDAAGYAGETLANAGGGNVVRLDGSVEWRGQRQLRWYRGAYEGPTDNTVCMAAW